MNEEISRILRMLEEGKINAEEAERLIRALREAESPRAESHGRAAPEPNPCATFAETLREIGRVVREAQRRQRRSACRYAVWCRYGVRRRHEQERRRRAENWNTFRRVKHVLLFSAIVDDHLKPEDRLRDLLDDQLAWDNLRFGLEEEFRIDVQPADLRALDTVQALMDYIDGRVQPASSAAAEPGESSSESSEAAEPAELGTDSPAADPERGSRRRPGGSTQPA